MQKIVTIGGGTGQFQILRGLRDCECEITAIVNIADNGGSSGRLRDEYGILPPGDIRQCIIGLTDESESKILRELFNYRLKDGHSIGNLIITALTNIYGSSVAGIKETSKLLGIKGKVLPVSLSDVVLFGETEEGEILEGQENITYSLYKGKIKRIFCKPEAFLYKEAEEEIRNADKIIICAGDLHGSILPNLIVNGMSEALKESKAMKIYVCNLFTKQGNYGFKASDFLQEIEKYSGIVLDRIIINNKKPSPEIVEKYLEEKSNFVEDDLQDDKRVIRGDYVAEYPSERKTIFRHVPEKIARAIISLKF